MERLFLTNNFNVKADISSFYRGVFEVFECDIEDFGGNN